MRINSPMLGTVDFSMIPAFFIDAATLLHGASSIGVTGGALGGAVVLGTRRPRSGAGKRNTCRASGRSRPSTNTCA